MKAKKKMQHLTLFLLKRNVEQFEDAVRRTEAGEPTPLTNQSFKGSLYFPEPKVTPPGWLPFIQSGFPVRNNDGNRFSSALVLLKAGKRMFALTFGNARHLLKPDSFERDFGLRVVVNSVNMENIRSISLRTFKEIAVKRQEEAAKGTKLRTFGIDTHQDLLRGVTGVPEDTSLASRISGSDSLVIDVAIEFGDLARKCKELLLAYEGDGYAHKGFDWIDNLKIERSPDVISQLDESLITALKEKLDTIQMLCPDSYNREAISGFLHHGECPDADKHTELEIADWQDAIGGELKGLTIDRLRKRRIGAYDENGAKMLDIPDRECFVFETEINRTKFVLSNGEWFQVATDFDAEITKYLDGISNSPVNLPHYSKEWEGEEQYVKEAAKRSGLMSMHLKTHPIGGTSIEPCDLLHSNGTLVHVKMWKKSAGVSHLLAQAAISSEALLHYPAFRKHVATSATKDRTKVKNLFDTDAFVTSKLNVVLALVRGISKPLPFFSRLNFMRECQRIERLGYNVYFQKIEMI